MHFNCTSLSGAGTTLCQHITQSKIMGSDGKKKTPLQDAYLFHFENLFLFWSPSSSPEPISIAHEERDSSHARTHTP